MESVRFGIDQVLDGSARLSGSRFGILTNDAARSSVLPGVPSRVGLLERGTPLVRLFSPEHGIGAAAPDGSPVDDSIDAATGLPVVSLYGRSPAPRSETLADLDAVLFDVQDAGARFYTYLWSLTHLIDACADAGIPVVVLDRQNPLGGVTDDSEGPLLDLECCASFLGRLDIPITHGLTLGELARLWVAERRPDAQLQVVPLDGWHRSMRWPELGHDFVPPSPALRTFHAVALYPGLCLFEAFNVSVGRGSDVSFESIGAPWLDPDAVIDHLRSDALEGVRFIEESFSPSVRPYRGDVCRGVRVEVLDDRVVRPVMLGMQLVRAVNRAHPDRLAPAPYPTAANPSGERHLSLLIGQTDVAARLLSAESDEIRSWTRVEGWTGRVAPYLLYR
jgi:uncharacterized protein YbbC (DUF1343 family)